jgi:hypothetical protein
LAGAREVGVLCGGGEGEEHGENANVFAHLSNYGRGGEGMGGAPSATGIAETCSSPGTSRAILETCGRMRR